MHGISSAAHCRFTCGFILLQAVVWLFWVFFPQKTKLDCDKYVAPNKKYAASAQQLYLEKLHC